MTANGPLKKLLAILLLAVVVVVGMTFWEPFEAGYQVKIAAKVACNTLVLDHRNGAPNARNWEYQFLKSARLAGIPLKPEQYSLTATLGNRVVGHKCNVHIRWRSTTRWFFIDDYVDIPPLEQVHDLEFEHIVNTTY